MKKKITFDYKNTSNYKMILILTKTRKGLKITCTHMAQRCFTSRSSMRSYELGKVALSSTEIRRYSDIIASEMSVNCDILYSKLKERANQLNDVSDLCLIKSLAGIFYDCEIIKENDEIDNNLLSDKEYNKRIRQAKMAILGSFRRMLDITVSTIAKQMGCSDYSICHYELRKKNANDILINRYAKFICEILSADYSVFCKLLNVQAWSIYDSKQNMNRNVFIACSQIMIAMQ